MRIGFQDNQPILVQVVDDPLHVLPIGPEIAGNPGHWL